MLSRFRIALLALLVCFPVAVTFADDAATRPAAVHAALIQDIFRLFAQKDYPAAAAKCREAIAAEPADPEHHYNLACALARLGEKDQALAELDRAAAIGYADVGQMLDDDDLAVLNGDPRFVTALKAAHKNEVQGVYEKGAEIAGVKTVEGNPAGGLRWRLRYPPDMDAQHPCRLLIWLHPSGGSLNSTVERMAPMFASHRLALLVFTQKDFRAWSAADIAAIAGSVADVQKKSPGLETKQPVLLGFSAGAQVAISLWSRHPGDFAGLVLDAGYPIKPDVYAEQHKFEVQDLPNDPAIKQTPILVLVGTADGGSQVWKKCEADWQKAGVPLTVRYVEGRRHEWLLNDAKEVKALDEWLAALKLSLETK